MLPSGIPQTQITIRRGNEEWQVRGAAIADTVHLEIEDRIKNGDIMEWPHASEPHIVTKVTRFPEPRHMAHETIKTMPLSDYEEKQSEKQSYYVTQHIGTADTVAGRDANMTVNVDVQIILTNLLQKIEEHKDIPAPEKKKLIEHIKSVLNNPYVSGIAVSAAVEAAKTFVRG